MYKRFLNQLKQYAQAIRVLSKGYLPISLLAPSKLNIILQKVKQAVQIRFERCFSFIETVRKVKEILWYFAIFW